MLKQLSLVYVGLLDQGYSLITQSPEVITYLADELVSISMFEINCLPSVTDTQYILDRDLTLDLSNGCGCEEKP
ncbi:unnamed protein product [Rotaria sp. Silwood1]|nr:unnamed protein product [Rotaria sp. Silwood1]